MKKQLALAVISTLTALSHAANAEEVVVSTKNGLSISDGENAVQIGGRIQYDYNKAELNGETDEDEFDVRRSRIFIKGNIGQDWAFKTQFNTNGSGVEDLFLTYKGWGKEANVTIGNYIQPFGLEQNTSSKDITILERSSATERFALGRQEGIKLHGSFGNSTYAASFFTSDVVEAEAGEEKGFSARYTHAPIMTDSTVVHVGIAYRDIEDDTALGLEAAASTGPFHIQGEYFDGDEAEESVGGYYIQAGYIFTGETRPYKGGIFKRVKPASKAGAWELVARIEEGDGNYGDIELGNTDATAYTIGLNWYANNNVRFGVNYTDGESNNSDADGNEFRMRFQLTF